MSDLSIQNVLTQRNNYNLAIPFVETQQINPFYKMSVSLLCVDTDERASQIFKVGSRILNNKRREDLYSLSKPFLQRLATEAGIQFGPGAGDVSKVDENTWKASAFGAIRLPDGNMRTSNNFKVIDLAMEEKKYRMAYEEKAESGIVDYKAAEDAAKKYAGEWKDTGQINDRGYPIKIYIVAERERRKYIENSLLDAMTQLRANAPQKAATGAILRVIRDLLGIKSTYTIDELKKPFAVARTSFSPDYNDPMIKQMLLQQAMQSVGNLFGNVQPVVQTISIPSVDDEVDIPADVCEAERFQAERAPEPPQQRSPQPAQRQQGKTQGVGRVMTEADRAVDFCCDKCGAVIKKSVWQYSNENLGQPLCYKCQSIVKRERKGGKR
ncbi:hypothetical protein E5329_23885 [Petralouisia muris]|uniref:Uncharacterized protein n=1 Tax=Petralouisia muris TaxID=3032872 RepID=A0AC61RPC1_9FIRM|nr:hypothetical protein [Petralouisia muris]TGY90881.1 hypothetical protein E5329_23885 [Petralouisia muris]